MDLQKCSLVPENICFHFYPRGKCILADQNGRFILSNNVWKQTALVCVKPVTCKGRATRGLSTAFALAPARFHGESI